MLPARHLSRLRATRAVRASVPRMSRHQNVRFQSTAPSSEPGSGGSHFVSGAVGGVVGAAVLFGFYSFTPAGQTASKVNKAAAEVTKTYNAAAEKLQKSTPNAAEAAESMKQFAYTYVAWVPGGRGYVDVAFNDWEAVREKHQDEADRIVNEAYRQLQAVSKGGLSMETAVKACDVIADMSKKIASLSGDAVSDLLNNHPQVKEKLGGSIEQLQNMGRSYGPEAKKQATETWDKLKDILTSGLGADKVEEARKLVQETVDRLKKLGDEAWKKGLAEAKPYLDKNAKAKELIEKNAEALKQSNIGELFRKVRSAVDSGDVSELQRYVKSVADGLADKGSEAAGGVGLDKYLKMIPQGDELVPKLQRMGQIAEKHRDEGERLLKETVEELTKVLETKSQEAQGIVDRAKKETK
ncbi:hypothetical protein DCS_01374 [Drechmeria coniospora]|uniref:Apolipoprotein/apolipophorin n=1 Tax=Drechmeria coniospora TaxID=98403 RepID=A0A151GT10_DRECN|nr:hypothetical protein DCS_01374 [Drechmeria coniospora]KYK60237.1 hypothetical protein DCS_01374 [Drechmeria coniospora]ODA80179.1 hypothetical protein RJ55_03137 [Drechmeria coniospora]